jgi:hypothetical protein
LKALVASLRIDFCDKLKRGFDTTFSCKISHASKCQQIRHSKPLLQSTRFWLNLYGGYLSAGARTVEIDMIRDQMRIFALSTKHDHSFSAAGKEAG